jgi:hypothetical protein
MFVNSTQKDVMCKFQAQLSIIFNYTNWTNQMKWVVCALETKLMHEETWDLHEITRLITTQTWEKSPLASLYIYDIDPCETISKWQKCVNFEIEQFDFVTLWFLQFWKLIFFSYDIQIW